MKTIFRTTRLRWIAMPSGDLVAGFALSSFAPGEPQPWQPAINAFSCGKCVRVCLELAGVDKSQIEVQAEPSRLLVRGTRQPPEPQEKEGRAEQVLALEIDYGRFEREIILPVKVDVDRITAEQRNGLLWIEMPILEESRP